MLTISVSKGTIIFLLRLFPCASLLSVPEVSFFVVVGGSLDAVVVTMVDAGVVAAVVTTVGVSVEFVLKP